MNILQNYPLNLKPPIKAEQASNNTQTEFKFVDNNSSTVGQATLWYSNMPDFKGEKIAFLGNYKAKSVAYGLEILHTVEEYGKSLGLTFIIGPVDGNTWSNYRLVTKGFDSAPFAMENFTDRTLPFHFLKAGYKSIATYKSTLVDTSPDYNPKDKIACLQSNDKDVKFRSFSHQNPVQDLEIMYEVSCQAFKNNFLYTPVSKQEFIEKYKPLIAMIDKELVLVAEDKGKPIGFVFALPNKTLAQGRDDTVVLKTLARIPNPKYKGLGLELVGQLHKRAYNKGYKKTIHALYKSDNKSSCFSKMEGATELREYELYGKRVI